MKKTLLTMIMCGLVVGSSTAWAHEDFDFMILPVPIGDGAGAPAYPARAGKSGQTISYVAGDDGNLEEGVGWPAPRFRDDGDGTVRDMLTGLTWLKNANCFGKISWADAVAAARELASGTCGLQDGTPGGVWRLPHRREFLSLIHAGYYAPALPNGAGTAKWAEGDVFSGVQSDYYWTSTTHAGFTSVAWYLDLEIGSLGVNSKATSFFVWPVRRGE
ncbi:MAG: DUF1566 domain-containing protein [Gammaproteobacteria bacterium]|nr:DUF1566 domain-containing protein [Gammaproteobacteria bacterium]